MNDLINVACIEDNEIPDGVSCCDDCEFNMVYGSASFIGAQIGNAGDLRYCEKGYWKEEV